MFDIIQLAAEFLKIDSTLVQQYMQQGVVQGIFFLFFFPSVFLFLFVYILMEKKGPGRADLKLLITVSVYAFIIMSGYYTYFVWISKWWLYFMLLLGVWYVIMHHGGGSSGGAQPKTSGGSFKTSGGVMGMFQLAKGEGQLRKQFYAIIKMIEDLKEKVMMKTSGGSSVGGNELSKFTELAEKILVEYEHSYGGPLNPKATEMRRALNRALSS